MPPPIKSNINKETCSPVSTNCVVWQGPDLECISVCAGETISEVVYQLALEICALQEQLNLTGLDLKCLVDSCLACPQPEKTLATVLQLLIDKLCTLEEIVNNLVPSGDAIDPLVRMAACFQYYDGDGDLIKDLPHTQYTKKIGVEVCNLANQITAFSTDIDFLQNQIDSLDGRVTTLENNTLPQVTLTCINPGPQDMDVAIEAIESDYCTLKGALGTAGELLNAIDGECLLPVKKLTDPTSDLWTGTSSNIAATLDKMWLAICDLRAAVGTIQNTCCTFSCDDILVDFDVQIVDASTIRLFFAQKSSVPGAFTDCNATLGNTLNIVDGAGNKYSVYIKLRDDVFNDSEALTNGYPIDISASPLDVSTGLTLSMNACLTDGSTTCVKCVNVIAGPATTCDFCTITASGSEGSYLVVIYSYTPINTTTA
jgi:hypothetical protein